MSAADLARLKAEFRRAFLEPVIDSEIAADEFLIAEVGGSDLAIPLSAIAGLFKDRRVHRPPSPVAEFLGLAEVRGSVIPVYDLRRLVGAPADAAPRWLVIQRGRDGVGLAFDRFVDCVAVDRQAVLRGASPGDPRGLVANGRTYRILDLEAVTNAITRPTNASQEP